MSWRFSYKIILFEKDFFIFSVIITILYINCSFRELIMHSIDADDILP